MKHLGAQFNVKKKGTMCKCNCCNIFDYCLPILIDNKEYYLCEYCRKTKRDYERKQQDFKSLLIIK